jgi:branched-chain amino acid aminotransferase
MPIKIYINGKFFEKKDAKVSVFDHGFLYGDGVFEGIRSYNRLVFRLEEHIRRLYRSADHIMLRIPIKKKAMIKAVCDTIKKNKLDDAYVRLIVTRGVGDLGLDPRKCTGASSVIIIADKIKLYPEKYYQKGLAIITAKTRQNSVYALNPAIKSLNYLTNILAKIEAVKSGHEEAIMLDSKGNVTECTGDNIFIAKNNTVYTPPLSVGILEGITRDAVIEIARKKKIKLKQKNFKLNDVYKADECFLTGTAAELIPVVRVDNRKIGNGKPGVIASIFLEEFRKMTKTDGMRY